MAQFLWEHESNGKDWLHAMLYRNNQQRLYLCLCTSVHSTEMWCVTFLASLLMLIDSFSYKEFVVLAHSTFTSSHSLTRKVWYYQPITSNGNKRSALNYSFGMSNNACRLLFRVGETHMNNSSAGFAFLRRVALWFRCLWVLSPCRRPLSFLSWPWLSLQQQHGWHRRWQGRLFFPYLQASSTLWEWVGRTTGSRLSKLPQCLFTVHYVPRCAEPVPMH